MKLVHLLVACICLACTPKADRTAVETGQTLPAAVLSQLNLNLRSRGDTVLSILTGPPGLFAVLSRAPDSSMTISYWQHTADSIRPFARTHSLETFPPSSARWIEYAPSRWMFYIAFDWVSEGVVGAIIYQVTESTLERIFEDGLVCRSSELIHDEREDRWVLVRYEPVRVGMLCTSNCLPALRENYGLEPGRMSIHRWTGNYWEELSGGDFPIVARQRAAALQAARELASSRRASECREDGFTESVLRSWAH